MPLRLRRISIAFAATLLAVAWYFLSPSGGDEVRRAPPSAARSSPSLPEHQVLPHTPSESSIASPQTGAAQSDRLRLGGTSIARDVWRVKVRSLQSSTNYRGLIHESVVAPTPEGVAIAMRVLARCIVLENLWSADAIYGARKNSELDLSLSRLKDACSQGTKDLMPALAGAAKRVNIPNELGDRWVVANGLDPEGLKSIVAIGDGDLFWQAIGFASSGGPSSITEALGWDPVSPTHLAQLGLATALEGCLLFGCDVEYRRLMVCTQLRSCDGANLEEQIQNLATGQGVTKEDWTKMRALARNSLSALTAVR